MILKYIKEEIHVYITDKHIWKKKEKISIFERNYTFFFDKEENIHIVKLEYVIYIIELFLGSSPMVNL